MKRWCKKCHQFLMVHPTLRVKDQPVLICSGRGCHAIYAAETVTPKQVLARPVIIAPPESAKNAPVGTCKVCQQEKPCRNDMCWDCTIAQMIQVQSPPEATP